MNRIYISGKISGIEQEASVLFEQAEKFLNKYNEFEIVNPMKIEHNHDKSWESYMRECVKYMCDCDTIFMLTNWRESKGAMIEHTIAEWLKMKIIYQQNFL